MIPYCIEHIFLCSLGPDDLTLGTLIPGNPKVIPTVTDNLFKQGSIRQKLIAVSFDPISGLVRSGELMFGPVDATKFTGNITYVYVCAAKCLLGLLCSSCLAQ